MKKTDMTIVRVGKAIACQLAGTFLVVAAGLNPCVANGYENDGPGAALETKAKSPMRLLAANSSSTFSPPKASDVQFVVTEGGDLHVTAGSGYPSHTIRIPLKIDRVYGDIQTLVANGALPKVVNLRMIVWDVDSDSTYNPAEHDEVLVNGHRVGFLQGHNQTWTDNTFPVPIEILNLKADADDVVSNTIQVNVDVDNGGWITKVDWVSIYIPTPPPVVIAHGIRSNIDTTMELKRAIETQIGVPVYTFSFHNKGNDGIADGAEDLRSHIETAKSLFHVDSVNIVAHSMGGLKTREYVTQYSDRKDVDHIFQIATPNGGAPLATAGTILEIIGLANDPEVKEALENFVRNNLDMNLYDLAIPNLTGAYLRMYNEIHPFNSAVTYNGLAGDVQSLDPSQDMASYLTQWFGLLLFTAESAFYTETLKMPIELPSDTIVAVDSVFLKGIYAPVVPQRHVFENMWTSSGDAVQVEHTNLIGGNNLNPWAGSNADSAIRRDKSYLLKQKTLSEADQTPSLRLMSVKSLKASPTAQEAGFFAPYAIGGTLTTGTTTKLPFTVLVGKPTACYLALTNIERFDATLVSPSGVRYQQDVDTADMKYTRTSNIAFCRMEKPEVGEWTIEVTPTAYTKEDLGRGLYALVQAEEDCQFDFGAKLKANYVKLGQPFVVTAKPTLAGQKVGGTVKAIVCDESNVTVTYEMRDDGVAPDEVAGDGVYAAEMSTQRHGLHQIVVALEAESPKKFSRMCLLDGVVYESDTQVKSLSARVLDSNRNGLYDELIVGTEVETDKNTVLRALLTLSDASGRTIESAWSKNVSCQAGTSKIEVSFDGKKIYRHGETADYRISSVALIEVLDSDSEAVVAERADALTMTQWKYDEFEHSILWIKDGGTDTAKDLNGDGIYDRLDVRLPLVSGGALSGSYQWSAALVDKDGLVMGFTTGPVQFPVGGGVTWIDLSYNGVDIASCGNHGPYYVKNFIFWSNNETLSIPDQYVTKAYRIQQWGGEPKEEDEPIISASVNWAYNVSSDSFFAQLNLACTNGAPSQIGSIRYLFERRTSPEAYLCDRTGNVWPQTIREAGGNTSFDGRTFYYVDIDIPEIRTSDVGTSFKYGVQADIPVNGIVDRIPVAERKIGLWIAGRDTLVNKATTEVANDYLGWLSWDANGKTNYIAVGNSALKLNQVLNKAKLTSTQAVPPSLNQVNRALALGASVLMEGSDPNCSISEFSVSENRVSGSVTLTSAQGVKSVPGSNVRVKLYGCASLDKGFAPVSELTLDANGRFDIVKPEGCAFFKVLIEVIDVVE